MGTSLLPSGREGTLKDSCHDRSTNCGVVQWERNERDTNTVWNFEQRFRCWKDVRVAFEGFGWTAFSEPSAHRRLIHQMLTSFSTLKVILSEKSKNDLDNQNLDLIWPKDN